MPGVGEPSKALERTLANTQLHGGSAAMCNKDEPESAWRRPNRPAIGSLRKIATFNCAS